MLDFGVCMQLQLSFYILYANEVLSISITDYNNDILDIVYTVHLHQGLGWSSWDDLVPGCLAGTIYFLGV